MIEEQLIIESRNLICRAKPYEWQLGIGIEIQIFEGEFHVGTVRLLCSKDDPEYEELAEIESATLLRKGLSGFLENRTETSLKTMDYWQSEIGKLGYNYVSPIYGSLAKCF